MLNPASLTVAVCTRDRPLELSRLLDSLSLQTGGRWDVLVVDNAPSTEASANLVRDRFPWARYVRERVPGLDFARNRALEECTSDIVAYIDDDAVAAADWAENIARIFGESPRIAACTGKMDALTLETPGARLFEACGGFGRGFRRIDLPSGTGAPTPFPPRPLVAWSFGVGSGVSMAVRRQVALDLGGFDEALDMGAVLPGGGDLDMLWRILEAGYRLVYAPTVHGWHEHRAEYQATEHQILGHHRAGIAMLTKFLRVARWSRKVPVICYLGWRLLKPVVKLCLYPVAPAPLSWRMRLRLVVAAWRGLLAYPAAQRLARERRSQYETVAGP